MVDSRAATFWCNASIQVSLEKLELYSNPREIYVVVVVVVVVMVPFISCHLSIFVIGGFH